MVSLAEQEGGGWLFPKIVTPTQALGDLSVGIQVQAWLETRPISLSE